MLSMMDGWYLTEHWFWPPHAHFFERGTAVCGRASRPIAGESPSKDGPDPTTTCDDCAALVAEGDGRK